MSFLSQLRQILFGTPSPSGRARENGEGMGDTARRIGDEADLEAALEEPLAFIYKHSPVCGVSSMAIREVTQYLDAGGKVPVYLVDVIEDRALSQSIASRLGVRHASPQAILVEKGVATWDTSHGGITSDALRAAGGER